MIRVTDLLRWGGITTPIPNTDASRKALQRGTLVHECSLIVEDNLPTMPSADLIPVNVVGYGCAVWRFMRSMQPVWHQREVRIDDHAIDLTGCPDRVGTINGTNIIVDYKTGGRYGWHRLQVALYAVLVERSLWTPDICPRFDKRLIVYLSPDGTYQVSSCSRRQDILEAWSLITRYRKEVTHVKS